MEGMKGYALAAIFSLVYLWRWLVLKKIPFRSVKHLNLCHPFYGLLVSLNVVPSIRFQELDLPSLTPSARGVGMKSRRSTVIKWKVANQIQLLATPFNLYWCRKCTATWDTQWWISFTTIVSFLGNTLKESCELSNTPGWTFGKENASSARRIADWKMPNLEWHDSTRRWLY